VKRPHSQEIAPKATQSRKNLASARPHRDARFARATASVKPAAPERSGLVFERRACLCARGARRVCADARTVAAFQFTVERRAEIARQKGRALSICCSPLIAFPRRGRRGRRGRQDCRIAPVGVFLTASSNLTPFANSPDVRTSGCMGSEVSWRRGAGSVWQGDDFDFDETGLG
jgi:hypothetical protein